MRKIIVDLLHFTPEFVGVNAVKKPYKNEIATVDTEVKIVLPPHDHSSVAEHTVINFNISGISRLNLQELLRHRMAELDIADMFSSATVESTRYTLNKVLKMDLDMIDIWDYFVEPLYDPKRFSSLKEYERFIMKLASANFRALEDMIDEMKRNTPNDFIKYYLPEGWRVDLAFSINLRSFLNFVSLRYNPKAHFEIRHLAKLMLDSIRNTYLIKFFPNI
jgi:thymidylate synthase (FAD)